MWFFYASMGLGAHIMGTLIIKYITRFLNPLEILVMYGFMIFCILATFIAGMYYWNPVFLSNLWSKLVKPNAIAYKSTISMTFLVLLILVETVFVVTRGYFNWKSIQLASNPAYPNCLTVLGIPIIAILSSLILGSPVHVKSIIGFIFMGIGVSIISTCPDDPKSIDE